MKLKNKISVLFIVALLCISLVFTIGAVAATEAETDFEPGVYGSAPIPIGSTWDNDNSILLALQLKFDEINASIKTAVDSGKTLTEAYANDEILTYSTVSGSNGYLSSANKNGGAEWKVWEDGFMSEIKFLYGSSSWSDGRATLSYDGVKKVAYIITPEFAEEFLSNGGQKLVQPIQDRVRINKTDSSEASAFITAKGATDYILVQNYLNGYMISLDGAKATKVWGKSFDFTALTENDNKNGNATGFVGATIKEGSDIPAGYTKDTFGQLFADKYESCLNNGFYLGAPNHGIRNLSNEVSAYDDAYNFIAQDFWLGDSVAMGYSEVARTRWSYIAFNEELSDVFVIRDEFMQTFLNKRGGNDVKKLGAPTGDDFTVTRNEVSGRAQNFDNGYIFVSGARSGSDVDARVTIVEGKGLESDGKESSLDPLENIGAPGASVTEFPNSLTSDSFKKLFTDLRNKLISENQGLVILPTAKVTLANGIYYQVYKTESSDLNLQGTTCMMYDNANNVLRFLNATVYKEYVKDGTIGYPVTDILIANDPVKSEDLVKAMGFSNGYIKITSRIVYDNEMNESYVDDANRLIGTTFNSELFNFEFVDYTNDVGKLNKNIDGAYSASYAALFSLPEKTELTNMFKDYYSELMTKGYCVGKPDEEGVAWWTTGVSGVIKQGFVGGNGRSSSFYKQNAVLFFDVTNQKVRLVTDVIGDQYGSDGASGNGWPVSDMMVYGNKIVQNFLILDPNMSQGRKAYIMYDGLTTTKHEFEHFDFTSEDGKKYTPYLDSFGSKVLEFSYSQTEDFAINQEISIDLKNYITNNDKYVLTFDAVSASVGSIDSNGIFKYTATKDEQISVSVTVCTLFEKIDLKFNLSFGEVVTEKPEGENSTGCGCSSAITAGQIGIISVLGVAVAGLCIVILFTKRKRNNTK